MKLVQIIYQSLNQNCLPKLLKLFHMFIKEEKLKNSHPLQRSSYKTFRIYCIIKYWSSMLAEIGGTEPCNMVDMLLGRVGKGTIQVQLNCAKTGGHPVAWNLYRVSQKAKGCQDGGDIQLHNIWNKFHEKLKCDVQLHDNNTEFHKYQSGFAYGTDISNCLVGWSLPKRLGTRNLQIFSVIPIFHCSEEEGGH